MDLSEVRDICIKTVLDTNALLVPFIFGITALIFLNVFPDNKRQPFHHLTKEERHRHKRWCHMPPMHWVRTLQFLANAFMTVSAVYYLYLNRDPVASMDKNYYLTIEVLFFVTCFFKMFWQHFQFNHFHHNVGIALAVISACICAAISLTLIVLLGIRAAYLAMGFMFPVLLYYIMTVAWSGHIAQHHWDTDW
jgi:hypothetical protein